MDDGIEEMRAKMEAIYEERRKSGYYNRHKNCKYCGESFNLSERESSRDPGYLDFCGDCSEAYKRGSHIYFELARCDPSVPRFEKGMENQKKLRAKTQSSDII